MMYQRLLRQVRWRVTGVVRNVSDTARSQPPWVHPELSVSFGRSTGQLEYKTLGQGFKDVAEKYSDVTAFVMEHQGIIATYGNLLQDSNRLANSLIDLGFKKGDVAGCWSANVYEYCVVYWALTSIGVINCSISPFYRSSEIEYALSKGGFKGLFLPSLKSIQSPISNYHSIASEIDFKKCPSVKHLIYLDGAEADQPQYGGLHVTSVDKLLQASNASTPANDVHSDDYHCLYLTSGTTGKPKLCALGHFGIYNNAKILQVFKKGMKQDETHHRACLTMPFFHAYAGVLGLGTMSVLPITYVIPGFRYNSSSTLSMIDKYNCTEWWSVPTMLYDLVDYRGSPEGAKFKASSLKTIVVGADIVSPELTKRCLQLFPNLSNLFVGYGATESHGLMSHTRVEDSIEMKTTTCGTAADFTQLKIIDNETGLPVKHGEKGELLVKGHNVMKCYWNDAEKTAEAVRNGWYYSGDQAVMSDDGCVNIVGRLKEMLIRAGINIFPREIEDVLHLHNDIAVAAVCGIPNERLGQEVVAWVKLKDPSSGITGDDIIKYCKSKLASYKSPSYVFIVDTFPMTASGKVQKFKMTEITIEKLKQHTK